MCDKEGVKKTVTAASTLKKAAKPAVPVPIPPIEVEYYLMRIKFPPRPKHIGSLELWKKKTTAAELWGDAYTANPIIRGDKDTDQDIAKKIQAKHRKLSPQKDTVLKAGGTQVLGPLPCMNYDLNASGKLVSHTGYDIQDQTLMKINTFDNAAASAWSTYIYSEEEAYGRYPRLALTKQDGTATEARVHCGREWRQRHDGSNNQNGHLLIDEDGELTELTGTHGCIRVSFLWAERIFAELKKTCSYDFSYSTKENMTVAKDGYEPATEGLRKTTLRDAPEPAVIGFLYAEESLEADWCFASSENVTYRKVIRTEKKVVVEVVRKGKKVKHTETEKVISHSDPITVSVCETDTWTKQDYIDFHDPPPVTSSP